MEKSKNKIIIYTSSIIQRKIFTIRDQQVMKDRDLAELYYVETRILKQAVRRNIKRFPEDFMFILTESEIDFLVSQSVIPSKKYLGGAKPFVFTEQGIAILSSVLTSDKAIEINIQIMRAFVEMRKFIANNVVIFQRLQKVEQKQIEVDGKFNKIFDALQRMKMKNNITSHIDDFNHIVSVIQTARNNAFAKVNEELINLYYNVGQFVYEKVQKAEWGTAVVDNLAKFIKENHPEIKGFTRRGLYRMKQFYETYKDNEFVSTLLTQIPWSAHLHILNKTKTFEEKEFYINLAIKEKLSVRELERQLNSAVFERSMLANKIVSAMPSQLNTGHIFKDTYVFEFLDMPKNYSEKDLRKALMSNLKDFILELGKGFSFVGEEYRVEVGNHDYYIDILFFHRDLQCLVAVELKIEEFQPEFIGKMNFYLEALDRDLKKVNENPSVGILLCKGKDEEVVEFAMARNISPTMIADYETKLIDKKLLRKKLHELIVFEHAIRKD